jgi:biotin carboxyl carrier protein
MQNEVRTPLAGVVERLVVAEGQTIELGDLLVVIGAGG